MFRKKNLLIFVNPFFIHRFKKKMYSKCGGALISNQWFLTSAQCLDGSDFIEVELGAMRLFDKTEVGRKMFNITSKDYYIHPSYNSKKPFVG